MATKDGSGFVIFNLDKLDAEIGRMKNFSQRLEAAVYAEAQAIFRKSQRIVPVDKGILKNSGVVEGPKNGEVLIGYGGAAKTYALIVHEDLEARHKEGKTAKYLERPFEEAMQGYDERIAARIGASLKAAPTDSAGSDEQ